MAVTAMLVGAWPDVLLVSRDPVARNLPLGPDQADPALADQAVQADFQSILGVRAPGTDHVVRLRPEIPRTVRGTAQLQGDEVLWTGGCVAYTVP